MIGCQLDEERDWAFTSIAPPGMNIMLGAFWSPFILQHNRKCCLSSTRRLVRPLHTVSRDCFVSLVASSRWMTSIPCDQSVQRAQRSQSSADFQYRARKETPLSLGPCPLRVLPSFSPDRWIPGIPVASCQQRLQRGFPVPEIPPTLIAVRRSRVGHRRCAVVVHIANPYSASKPIKVESRAAPSLIAGC